MLQDKISLDLKQAMKDKDTLKLSVLRMVLASINNESINLNKKDEGLSDEEVIKVLKREVKKRKDSIEQYRSGGRIDLADAEIKELPFLEKYLPAEMGEDEIGKIVTEVVAEMGGSVSPTQFGLVMKAVMAKTNGQADGTTVSKVVKEVLK